MRHVVTLQNRGGGDTEENVVTFQNRRGGDTEETGGNFTKQRRRRHGGDTW